MYRLRPSLALSRSPVALLVLLSLLALLASAAEAGRRASVNQSIKQGSTLTGDVDWTASVPGPKSSVDSVSFAVDDVVLAIDTSNPFAFGLDGVLDTTRLANGTHSFEVTATMRGGDSATSIVDARVDNTAPTFEVSQSVSDTQILSGMISWSATTSGIPSTDVVSVEFLVDGQRVHLDSAAPFGDAPGFFDSRGIPDGVRTFSVKATARDGRTATASAAATVRNTAPAPGAQPSFPIYAAFTYPWYPETWTVDGAHVFYRPTLGYYSTTDITAQQAHIRELDYAGMEASISSWWGPGHYTDSRLRQLMQTTVAMGSNLKWTVYYEVEGYQDPTVDKLAADLAYIRDTLATSPAYLRVDGRFVVFVYSADDTSCALNDRWKQANERIGNAAYVDLKVYYGYRSCGSQPDSWHQYGPVMPSDEQSGYSITISPGFWRANEPAPRLARDPARWRSNVSTMVASSAPWKLVTTFNEWTEGTAVESALDWASPSGHGTYIDALHDAIVGP